MQAMSFNSHIRQKAHLRMMTVMPTSKHATGMCSRLPGVKKLQQDEFQTSLVCDERWSAIS